jgi:hypothetical protein
LDFATLSFQVPSQFSAARATELVRRMAQQAARETMSRFFRMNSSFEAKGFVAESPGAFGWHQVAVGGSYLQIPPLTLHSGNEAFSAICA